MSKKFKIFITCLLGCLGCTWSVMAQSGSAAATLNDMDKGKHRILLVFAPNSQNELLQEQNKMLRQAHPGLTERDMLVVQVIENNVELNPDIKEAVPSAGKLRQEYKVNAEQFSVVLLGKDGGEKYRAQHPQAPAVLFQIIDAMPMRQSEMHGKRSD
ncbi:DUF4174 domain-containing protein [Adhaeribacter swui]|uniref:DUF4174 domain-containing protein n=1 Tax=Adhaeribacter swui TaxID=2086471 RepID=A0A7G7G3D8_9BACT|nr:DUF4174 domain-containing protein [Adhaeribacter swui]QNF31672.1 DUF4174 domain-containing protein [Adhaeribacter swui]